ncbi:hypothetical protein FC774_11510 [Clostridium botulinum]|uniref:Uncharacterized protein n=1 Tax=Clostridium botulinum TaxID=1491 RepID=A0A6M0V6M4_CLOBO|nr:hypothetical protein [Clostridium botulinum]NFE59128.1 hypothetical protein [Clostridium botulinum]NFE84561.1 hypothetical protein [Clostridium botulinum]NFF88493.1 hypothetical protein [Clostridium botulinum]NFG10868.1 hypothetical protein [Clostridium botulinum]NFI52704.1 hypothetical protein [Clostridium botulinum]
MKRNVVKYWTVKIIIFSGIATLLLIFWQILEICLDGGIHIDNSDNVIATILVVLLENRFMGWLQRGREC